LCPAESGGFRAALAHDWRTAPGGQRLARIDFLLDLRRWHPRAAGPPRGLQGLARSTVEKPPKAAFVDPCPACEQSHRVAITWRSPTPRDDGREPDVLIGVEEEEEVGAP
jgi:hypothetical protein